MIISFSGIDGTGKTTIAKRVLRFLLQSGLDSSYRHEYNYFILKFLFKLVGKKRVEGRRRHFLSKQAKKSGIDKIWPYLTFLDAMLLVLWLKLTKRNKVVLLDRCLHDQLISFEGLNVAGNLIGKLYKVAPHPDIQVFLSVSPEVAYNRKKETHSYPLRFYKKGNKRYNEIARSLQLEIFNTDQSLELVLKNILRMLLSNSKFAGMIVKKGANNRVIYKLINDYEIDSPYLRKIQRVYQKKLLKVQLTLDHIHDFMKDAEVKWLLYKSYMPFPYVPTYDLDILVHPSDRKKMHSFLIEKNIPYKEEEEDKLNIKLDGLYPISIHFGAGWEGINYISTETLWTKIQNVRWYGRSVNIPSYEAELLSHSAHIFFELSFIRLSDILYLSGLMDKKIDWNKIILETECNNWKDAFSLVISLVERTNPKIKAVVQLPYPVPYFQTVRILLEILVEDYRRKRFSHNKLKEYFREVVRYAFWRIGARILGRAPFGEILSA